MEDRLSRAARRATKRASTDHRTNGRDAFDIIHRPGYPTQVVGERLYSPGWPLRDCVMTDGPVEIAMGVVSAALDRQQAALERRRG